LRALEEHETDEAGQLATTSKEDPKSAEMEAT
jgi:hypothetical protein